MLEQFKPAIRPLNYTPPHAPLDIIHKDKDLLVLNKPSGLLSVPGKACDLQDSLELRAKAEFPEALLVHRLDMDTSGVFIMARNKDTQRNLGLQFERRKTEKTYIARVYGSPERDEGLIDLPLRCDWPNRPLQMVCYEHGKPAQTKWKVLSRDQMSLRAQRSNLNQNDQIASSTLPPRHDDEVMETALMELTPITGRSHQLRLHMLKLGHPILGDCFYAPERVFRAAPRLLLHAQTLEIHHPKDGTRVKFCAETPF